MFNIKAATLALTSIINNNITAFKAEYKNQLKSVSVFCGVNPVWDQIYNGDANINTLFNMGYTISDVLRDLSKVIKKYAPYIEEDMHSLRTNPYGSCLDDDEYNYISDFCKALGTNVYIKHHDIDMSIVVGYDTIHCIIYLFAHLIGYKLHSLHNSNYNTIDGGITFSEHLNNYDLYNHTNDDINYRLFEQLTYAAGCICACNHCL